jgi:hypothetical protein
VLLLTNLQASDAAAYSVTVSNSLGGVTSNAASLTVVGAPAISTQPANVSASEGGTATFSVSATGANLCYQWTLNSVGIGGATSASYTTPTLSLADNGGVYGVLVYNGAGLIFSQGAVLTVIAGPTWQGATLIEIGNGNLPIGPSLAMDPNGNAFAIWVQNGSGFFPDVWADRYVASTGWEPAALMETTDTNVGSPSIAIQPNGNAMAVWPQTDGIRDSIWASRYAVGSGWSTPVLIETDNAGHAYSPSVAIDPSGNAVAVWSQSDGTRLNVWANRYVAGVGWGAATLIENDSGNMLMNARVAMDANGNAIAVWTQSDGLHYNAVANRYVAGVGWGTATLIESDNAGNVGYPTIAMDSAGNAIAVWGQSDGTRYKVWTNRYVVGSGWGTAALLENDNSGDANPSPVVMDANGNAMVAWNQFDGIRTNVWANRYVAGSGWGTATLIENNNTGDAGTPSIAMNASGGAVAVWHQSNGTHTQIWANHFAAVSGWGTPLLIETDNTTDAIYPSVVISASGSAIATWVQGDGSVNQAWANVFK